MPAIASRVSTYSLVWEACGVCLRERNMCFELLLAAATSLATAARTSSRGEGESSEELKGETVARELAAIPPGRPASRALSKTAVAIRINFARLILSRTLTV